jgi:PKHD-type hydroxylase
MYLFHLRPNLAGLPTYVGNLLTPEECKAIISTGERDLKLGPDRTDDERVHDNIRKSDIAWLSPEGGEHRWLFDRIKDCVNAVNADWFRYNLIGFEGIQFTKYSGKGQPDFYASHTDLKSTELGTIRKLSFSIQLSDPEAYDGGDVLLYDSLSVSATMSKTVGSITFFPSYTIHEVLPVTRGIRYSLVGWAHGPPFV